MKVGYCEQIFIKKRGLENWYFTKFLVFLFFNRGQIKFKLLQLKLQIFLKMFHFVGKWCYIFQMSRLVTQWGGGHVNGRRGVKRGLEGYTPKYPRFREVPLPGLRTNLTVFYVMWAWWVWCAWSGQNQIVLKHIWQYYICNIGMVCLWCEFWRVSSAQITVKHASDNAHTFEISLCCEPSCCVSLEQIVVKNISTNLALVWFLFGVSSDVFRPRVSSGETAMRNIFDFTYIGWFLYEFGCDRLCDCWEERFWKWYGSSLVWVLMW